MKKGSIVQAVVGFEVVRQQWGYSYPKKGDILTVSEVAKHPNPKVSKAGIVLLYFEELPNMIGICDKTINGCPNFLELHLPDCIEEALSAPIELHCIK